MTATHHRSSRNDANATIGFNPYRGRLPVCCDTASVVTLLACITPAALEIPKSRMRWLARLGIFYLVSTSMAWTQEPAITPSAPDQGLPSADASTNGEKPETDSDSASAALSSEQDQIAEKYRRLEMLMLRMAEFDANSKPRRAALLKQALSRSKENHIATDMKQLVDLLTQQELQQAVDQQSEVNVNLRQVLDLLQSENRADRLKSEQQRVKGYIQQLERILRQQRSLQGRTEGGEDTERLAQEQGTVGDRADELSKEIDKNEQTTPPAGQPPNDAKPSDGSPPKSSDEPKPNDQPESSEENAPGDGDQKEPSQADGKNEQQGSKQTEGTDTPKGEKESDEKSNTNDEQNRADDSQNAEEPQEGEDVRAEKTDGSIIEGQLKKKNAERVEIEDQQGNQTDIPREELKKIERKKQSDSPQGQPQPSDGQTPTDEKPTDSKPSSDTPQQPAPGSPQNSPPSPGDGQPGESQSQTPPPSQDQPQPSFPGQKSIQQARQKMRDAQKKLEQSQRDGAVEEQEEARRLLEQAKAELEEILRQMREEEVQRTLADLESRFRKMLEWQIKVYEDTQTLDKLPPDQRATQQVVQSGKLSLDERKILGEADKALLLLREEGSSVAFPEAVEQMRSDIETVVDRLSQVKIDSITIGIEEDIIAALEEVVAALQKAQQDAEQRRQQQQQQQQPSDPQDQPLVDAIAELKMIRTLQVRVNKRTDDYAKRLSDPEHEVGQATQQDLLGELRQLAGRELRIRQLTRDIVLGKNQ